MILPAKYLKAAQLMAAKEDIRYYLNGVSLSVKDGLVVMCGTNGHVMCLIKHDLFEGKNVVDYKQFSWEFIIPQELLDPLKAHGDLSVEYNEETCIIEIKQGALTISGKAINGKFPNPYKLVPETLSGEEAYFSLDYLKLAHRVAKLATGIKVNFCAMRCNGSKPGVYPTWGYQENIVILIMPGRECGSYKDYRRPDWTK